MSDFSADQVQVTVLPNGLTVATATKPIHTVMISVATNVGANYESEAENGISHFLEHMAFKGTPTRNPKDIVYEIEGVGGDVNAMTGRNTTSYLVNGLPEHIPTALDILSDVLKNSTLPADEITREKEAVVQEIYEYRDDIHDVAYQAVNRTAFPDQPHGRPILGSEENVRSFDTAVLAGYMDRHYQPNNMVVVAVGKVDHAEFVAEVTARFGDMVGKEKQTRTVPSYVGGQTVIVDTSYEQAHLFVAFPVAGILSDDFAVYDLLSDMLGGGMSSPLFQKVREEKGLCYSVGAGLFNDPDQSLFAIQGSTTAENVEEFLRISCIELGKIAKGDVDERDWTRAKNQALRQVVSRTERPMAVAQSIAGDIFTTGAVRKIADIRAMYERVTLDDVIAAAKSMITTPTTVVVAGNAKEMDYAALVAESLVA